MNIKENLKEGKNLLILSTVVIIVISIVLNLLLLIKNVKPFLENVLLLVGFTATLYSVFLTILLFNFLSMSKAKFWLGSKQFVERNQNEILDRVIQLSNLVKQLVINKKSNSGLSIPDDFSEYFHYIKTINDKYTNEQTMLNQCRETFKEVVEAIEKSGLITATNVEGIELEKLVKIEGNLVNLSLSLVTIFNIKE